MTESYLQISLLCSAASALSEHVSISALRLSVALQVHPALEAVLTAGAAERPVAAVLPAVGDEVGALAECLPTYLTHVGLLAWHRNTAQVI